MGRIFNARRRARNEGGAAAVEFAFVAPLLFLLAFAIIQYGMYLWSMQAGTSAVGEAVRRMSVGDCQTGTEVQTLIKNRLGNATTATSHTGIVINTRNYTKADGTPAATNTVGEVGGTVTLSITFPSLDLKLPLVWRPNNGNVTRSATARIEDTTSQVGGCT